MPENPARPELAAGFSFALSPTQGPTTTGQTLMWQSSVFQERKASLAWPPLAITWRAIPIVGLLLIVAGCSAPPSEQPLDTGPDYRLRPSYGTVHLDAGFRYDPWQVTLQAGGRHAAAALAHGCAGFIAGPPDVDLIYRAGDFSLYILATSKAETTLVVNAPDGSWHCSDELTGVGPLITFSTPASGMYNIWVGSISGRLEPATLFVSEIDPQLPSEGFGSASGSGFFVSAGGHLVTNAHLVDGCAAVEVVDHGPATVLLVDAEDDLALLQVRDRRGPHAIFQTEPPRLGTDVLVVGYPLQPILMGSLNVTTGVVSGQRGIARDPRYFQFTAPLQPGNSGGPVIDEAGRVLGVATFRIDQDLVFQQSGLRPQNLNFAIRNDVVLRFLARLPVAPSTGAGGTPRPRTEVSEFGAAITVQVVCTD